jgi:hypothetical protein
MSARVGTAGRSATGRQASGTQPAPVGPRVLEATRWAAELGAVTADALATRSRVSVASARAVLQSGVRAGVLSRSQPLHCRPALYAATARGLRATGSLSLGAGRVSASNAAHLMAVAHVAASLERRQADHRVQGERELRRDERLAGRALASARLGTAPNGSPALHRADLVLWPDREGALPVVVEVELTIKAPRRLAAICRAWARCQLIDAVLYYAPPDVSRAVRRAIEDAHAGDRVVVLPLADTASAAS